MAKIIEQLTPGMSMPTTTRMYAQPLDVSGYFTSINDADTYARTSPIAYVGQVLTVVNNENHEPERYVIFAESGPDVIVKLPNMHDMVDYVTRMTSGMSEMGFQGTVMELMESTAAKKGQMFVFDAQAKTEIAKVLQQTGWEELPNFPSDLDIGDMLIFKDEVNAKTELSAAGDGGDLMMELFCSEGAASSWRWHEHITVVQNNLTGAVTSVSASGQSGVAGQAVMAMTSKGGQLTPVFGNMPRRRTCVVSAAGNYAVAPSPYPFGTEEIDLFLNGIRQQRGVDYTVTAETERDGSLSPASINILPAMGFVDGDELVAEFLSLYDA